MSKNLRIVNLQIIQFPTMNILSDLKLLNANALAKQPLQQNNLEKYNGKGLGIAHWKAVCESMVRDGEQNFKNENCG